MCSTWYNLTQRQLEACNRARRTVLLGAVAAAFAAIGLVAGCDQKQADGPKADGAAPAPLSVVCTTGMVADVVGRVGGDAVKVTALMGEGVDPHLYKPSPGDVRALTSADIVFVSGLHLEGKMGDVIEKLAESRSVVAITDGIPREKLYDQHGKPISDGAGGDKHAEGVVPDPHVWFDVSLWSATVPTVRDAITKARPAAATAIAGRAAEYQAELAGLDTEVRAAMGAIPKEKRVLVTAHDAFGYFGRAYGLEVIAPQGISTESEASLKDVNLIVETLVSRKIPAVFIESSVPAKTIESLIEGAKSRGHAVRLGGTLYSDALGKSGTPEGTYIGMVRANVRAIVEGLK